MFDNKYIENVGSIFSNERIIFVQFWDHITRKFDIFANELSRNARIL